MKPTSGNIEQPLAAGPTTPVVFGSGDLEIVSWDGRLALGMAAALLAANGFQYLQTVAMARLLDPGDFGAIAALLALVLFGAVPGLAFQAVAARHTARRVHARTHLDGLWAATSRLVVACSLALATLMLALTPALQSAFNLQSPAPLLWLMVSLACLPVLSSLHGLLQGRERFGALSGVLVAGAVIRLLSSLSLVGVGFGVAGAMAGVAVGYVAETIAALVVARPGRPALRSAAAADVSLAGELLRAGLAILTLLAFVNVDVLLARVFLPPAISGLYAVGSVFTKIAFWAPQFVTVTFFPKMAIVGDHRPLLRRALAMASAVGLVVVAGTALVAGFAVPLVFGDEYRAIADLAWAFALLGAVVSLLNLLLQTGLARGRRLVAIALAAAIAVECTVVALWLNGSPGAVLAAASSVSLATLCAAVLQGFRFAVRDGLDDRVRFRRTERRVGGGGLEGQERR